MARKIGVGVIGARLGRSWAVAAHLPALLAMRQFEVRAVATSNISSARATAAQFRVPQAFGDPAELVRASGVDLVCVCVRVPAHHELVSLALGAGKHVYCEWPLARNTEEARALAAAAAQAGVVHIVGLQGRSSPVLGYAKELVSEGAIGTVRSVSVAHSADWFSRPNPDSSYLQDRASGAHFLSIVGGHTMDTLCWMLGEFANLSAVVKTTINEVEIAGTGQHVQRTSADQVAVVGELQGGATATVRLSGASAPGTGVRLEISGDNGDLVVLGGPGSRGIQIGDLHIFRTVKPGVLAELEVPRRFFTVPESLHHGPALNVAEAYAQLARAIEGRSNSLPDFGDAVALHELLDRVEIGGGQIAAKVGITKEGSHGIL